MARTVGIRSLKNEASRLVRAVEAGESIVITRNGRAIARLVPEGMPAGIEELIEARQASWSGRQISLPESVVPEIVDGPSLAEAVIADRGER